MNSPSSRPRRPIPATKCCLAAAPGCIPTHREGERLSIAAISGLWSESYARVGPHLLCLVRSPILCPRLSHFRSIWNHRQYQSSTKAQNANERKGEATKKPRLIVPRLFGLQRYCLSVARARPCLRLLLSAGPRRAQRVQGPCHVSLDIAALISSARSWLAQRERHRLPRHARQFPREL